MDSFARTHDRARGPVGRHGLGRPGKGAKPPEESAKPDKVGTIEYYKNDKGKWRFIIKDENDKSIVMPLAQISYESKDETLKAIEQLKKILTEVKPTERAEKK